jgi:plastocyanin
MRFRQAVLRGAALMLPVVALVFVAACSSNNNESSTQTTSKTSTPAAVTTSTSTPAATSTRTATPAAAASASATAAASGSAAAENKITIVATDNKYDKTSLTVKAGQPVTLTLENKGAAIHDWHLDGVKTPDGKDINTKLIPGGQSDTITFTIPNPGTYNFECQVHPTEMKGTITAQ